MLTGSQVSGRREDAGPLGDLYRKRKKTFSILISCLVKYSILATLFYAEGNSLGFQEALISRRF